MRRLGLLAHIIDLGCGTGILTVTLARPDRRVTGVDPAPAMLERARNRPGGDHVTWTLGTADQLQPDSADLVLMSGNVAMHILEGEWDATLAHIARALRSGGLLVFESRNPEARAWEQWNDEPSTRDTPVGRLQESTVTDPPDHHGIVTMHCHSEFTDDHHVIGFDQRLQFRTHESIKQDLATAGLHHVATYRDWEQTPFQGGPSQPLMVFVARRP